MQVFPVCLATICAMGMRDLRPGPRGGLSENWSCGGCGARFNKLGPNCELGAQVIDGPKPRGQA